MNKIIKLDLESVVIATKDGTTIRVPYEEIEFKPEVGDIVELYADGEKTIVHKVEKAAPIEDKIQINIVNEQVQAQAQEQVQVQEQVQEQVQVQAPFVHVQSGKVVNKLAYTLLAILLGGIGAHKFYSGKFLKGFIYLIFCWTYIPAIIGLIEGIIAAFKTPDANGNIVV